MTLNKIYKVTEYYKPYFRKPVVVKERYLADWEKARHLQDMWDIKLLSLGFGYKYNTTLEEILVDE